MNTAIPLGYFASLIMQIEIDFNNLKKSFEMFKKDTTDKKLISELCRNYSFLFQDVKYIEKFKQNISGLELPVSVRFLKDLEEIKILLGEVKEVLINSIFRIPQ